MPFVIDASILAAWLLPDEARQDTDALLDRVIEERPCAPDLLQHEFRSLLVKAVRRKRVAETDLPLLIRRHDQIAIRIAGPGEVRAVLALALKHHLTPYDTAYLDLALDEALPLASLDKDLRRAAAAEGVALLPPAMPE
jgi:predicted nucleic acid-binding protein